MSSDQQYPYDPERGHGAPRPGYRTQPPARPGDPSHEPHGGASDMESTQTWQGQTWDTGSQPAVDWPAAPRSQRQEPYQESYQGQDPSYRQAPQAPQQHAYPQAPQQPGYPQGPQQHAYAQYPRPEQGPQGQSAAASYQQPPAPSHQQARTHQPSYGAAPGAPQVSSAEETAYLRATAPAAPAQPSGAYPLPPEVPVGGPGTGGPGTDGPGAVQAPHAAPTEALPPVPAYAGPAHARPDAPAAPGAGSLTGAPASAPGGSEPSGYSPPTTLGNARVTDAQRARAEGRSPIIAPGIQPAGLTAVLALLLAGGAALGSYALLVPVVLLQAVTAAGWFRLNGMWPARQGIALAFLGGLVADVALLAVGKGNGPAAIIGTLGVWVLLTVVLQLRSHADPDTRLSGLFATVVSAALAIIATGYLASSKDAVVAGAVVVAVTTLVRALPLPGPASVVASLVVAAGAGLVMGAVTDFGSKGVVLGLGAGVCALVGLRAASYDYPSRFVHMTAGVALPLTAAAPMVYLLGRALG
ncbi:hypothetical protein [Streptomyces sp. NBC_01497]|uniref:hypothetical protein n=1 Tax=Streptomyces sp. NBC_01497 TaxID=2903885 RepID=UPI002E2FF275|nr:hypothetical protein [Streptomyces sp. NBC_01497]